MSDCGGSAPVMRIGQYWDAEEPPDYIQELFDSFRDRNPEFRHQIFSRAGAERFIGERFGEREAAAFRACAIPSMQSDYFRYCFVLADGGIYADADYRCCGPLRLFAEGLEGGEMFLGPRRIPLAGRMRRHVWSGFFGFRAPGHPFLRIALDIATANLEARIAESVWGSGSNVVAAVWLTVGPGIPTLMRLIGKMGSFDTFLAAIAHADIKRFGELYCTAIGSYERLAAALEGVRMSPFERLSRWVETPEETLPYKQTDRHWHNVRGPIFTPRDVPSAACPRRA